MAKSRMIDPRMWSDGWFRRLNALDRYAFMYFLTNEHSSWCGVYELDISIVAFESGIDERDLKNSIIPNLEPKVYYIDGWIYIKNWEKYHSNASPQTKKGIDIAWNLVPYEIRLKIAEIDGCSIPPIGSIQGASSLASALASASASAPTVGIENDSNISHKGIVTIIEKFKKISPSLNYGNKTERKACDELIEKFGLEEALRMVDMALAAQMEDKFSPRATKPSIFWSKIGDFIVYFQGKNKSNKVSTYYGE